MATAAAPPCGFKGACHWPRFYRYRVALPASSRATWNRYDGLFGSATIGALVVVGRYAYCVKWADATVVR